MTRTYEGYLLIADITGYTMYLSQSELEHAQEILTSLLELLLAHTRPPLVLSRLAGDAVISYGLRGSFFQGQTFIEMIEKTYIDFRAAIEGMVLNNTCRCNACNNIQRLDLKFFVHFGSFAIQHISGHDELVGSDVNLLHRLLKNHVMEQTGYPAYTLYSEPALQQLGIIGLDETMTPLDETYEHLGTVKVWVQDMHPVWEKRRESGMIRIAPGDILLHAETEIALPPETVWDYLVEPVHLQAFFAANRVDVLKRSHGRIVEGSEMHCYHGQGSTGMTILEWKPFERMLMNCAMPFPKVTSLHELRLSPSEVGTCLEQNMMRCKGPLLSRLVADIGLRQMAKRATADLVAFKERIESDHARRAVKFGE